MQIGDKVVVDLIQFNKLSPGVLPYMLLVEHLQEVFVVGLVDINTGEISIRIASSYMRVSSTLFRIASSVDSLLYSTAPKNNFF